MITDSDVRVTRVYGKPKEASKQLLLDRIRMLEQVVQQSNEREDWLKSQVEIAQASIKKLVEYRLRQKRGIFSCVLQAINGV